MLFCQNILYRNCIFQYIFHPFFSKFGNILLTVHLKCLGSGQKPRKGRETWSTHIFCFGLSISHNSIQVWTFISFFFFFFFSLFFRYFVTFIMYVCHYLLSLPLGANWDYDVCLWLFMVIFIVLQGNDQDWLNRIPQLAQNTKREMQERQGTASIKPHNRKNRRTVLSQQMTP